MKFGDKVTVRSKLFPDCRPMYGVYVGSYNDATPLKKLWYIVLFEDQMQVICIQAKVHITKKGWKSKK